MAWNLRRVALAAAVVVAVAGISTAVAAKTGAFHDNFVPTRAQACAGIDGLDTSKVIGTTEPKRLSCSESMSSLALPDNTLGTAVWTNEATNIRVSVQINRNQEPPKADKNTPITVYNKTFDALYNEAPKEQRCEFTMPGRAGRAKCVNMLGTTNPTIAVDMGGSYVLVWVSMAGEAEYNLPEQLTTPVMNLTGDVIQAVYGSRSV